MGRRDYPDEDDAPKGRFYKRVREQTPKILGKRVCPNCNTERDLKWFKRIRRGRGSFGWICDKCFADREMFRRK